MHLERFAKDLQSIEISKQFGTVTPREFVTYVDSSNDVKSYTINGKQFRGVDFISANFSHMFVGYAKKQNRSGRISLYFLVCNVENLAPAKVYLSMSMQRQFGRGSILQSLQNVGEWEIHQDVSAEAREWALNGL
jgi:hypothetical protein